RVGPRRQGSGLPAGGGRLSVPLRGARPRPAPAPPHPARPRTGAGPSPLLLLHPPSGAGAQPHRAAAAGGGISGVLEVFEYLTRKRLARISGGRAGAGGPGARICDTIRYSHLGITPFSFSEVLP